MIETFMNLNIPQEVLTGLITRQYSLHGGVIRWAAGTEQAGQIIRHLVPAIETNEQTALEYIEKNKEASL
ncbi:hypothetical protein BCS42_12340 [Crenothrix sp. D3]|nr:hypothetical protein BCS42_12340 [Crenothrix sp. D3]